MFNSATVQHRYCSTTNCSTPLLFNNQLPNTHHPIVSQLTSHLRQVQVHLVTIKIRIEGATAALVESEGAVRADLGEERTEVDNV